MIRLLTLIISITLSASAGVSSLFNPYGTAGTSGYFTKELQIVVTNSGSALSNFQVLIPVTNRTGMNSDFSDVRFAASDRSVLNYWLESKTNSTIATFWAKIPTLSATGNTTIFMYYGNAYATSASSGGNTFDFFEGWDTTNVFKGRWGAYDDSGPWNVSGGCLSVMPLVQETRYETIRTETFKTFTNGIVQASIRIPSAGDPSTAKAGIIFRQSDVKNGYAAFLDYSTQTLWVAGQVNGSWTIFLSTNAFAFSTNTWHTIRVACTNTNFKVYLDGSGAATADVTDATFSYGGVGCISLGCSSDFDDIVVTNASGVQTFSDEFSTPITNVWRLANERLGIQHAITNSVISLWSVGSATGSIDTMNKVFPTNSILRVSAKFSGIPPVGQNTLHFGSVKEWGTDLSVYFLSIYVDDGFVVNRAGAGDGSNYDLYNFSSAYTNEWNVWEISRTPTGSTFKNIDHNDLVSAATHNHSESNYILLHSCSTTSEKIYCDWMAVRKYANAEPTITFGVPADAIVFIP